jgi:D-alanine--D-alanine ligase
MARIALLTGGSTPERDVALAGASQVAPALRALGHEVVVVDTVEGPLAPAREAELLDPAVDREPPSPARLAELAARENLPALVAGEALRGFDLVFLVLHGGAVEGGLLQALLDLAGLRYTGSDALGSAIAMDKEVSKRLLREAGIPIAEWRRWPASAAELAALGWPLVVKPASGGSSVGLSVAHGPEELPAAVAAARAVDREVLVERFLPGRELTVGVLGERAHPHRAQPRLRRRLHVLRPHPGAARRRLHGAGDPHVLADIETLNRAAFDGTYEITACRFHAYAHLAERYQLMPSGASASATATGRWWSRAGSRARRAASRPTTSRSPAS